MNIFIPRQERKKKRKKNDQGKKRGGEGEDPYQSFARGEEKEKGMTTVIGLRSRKGRVRKGRIPSKKENFFQKKGTRSRLEQLVGKKEKRIDG